VQLAVSVFERLLGLESTLRRDLEARLLRELGLTLKDYEALAAVLEAGGYLRRVDLAERVRLTPSGVTRLLEGLERLGLVERGACDTDARVTYAVVTEAGRRAAGAAAVLRDETVRERIAAALSAEELAALDGLLGRLPGSDAGPCPLGGAAASA
jgi:DNA-binding MarR family transcriptional regulator